MIPMPPPPSVDDDDWPAAILEDAKTQFNGMLTVLDPSNPVPVGPEYDPITGTGGETAPAVVIESRPARAQHRTSPIQADSAMEPGFLQRYHFQCEILPGDPAITKGMIVKFAGGKDPRLANMIFNVQFAANSSHAALRTIRTTTEATA